MTVTATTHSKPIGWSRSDVIDQIEDALTTVGAHMGPVTGLVGGIKSWTTGGQNTDRSNSNEWDRWYDVFPSSSTGSGTGASFEIGSYGGQVRYVKVNRQGYGYVNGDVLTLNDLDFGGTGSNGVQDINVTVFVEGYASGGSTYNLGYDSSNNLTGIDANGSIASTNKDSAANITIAEGDTLILKGLTSSTYIFWYDANNDSSLGNGTTTGSLSSFSSWYDGWMPANVVNQAGYQYSTESDSWYLKWKPSPGQAGTYYIKSSNITCIHTITVVAASSSNVVAKSYGTTSSFFDKQNRQSAVSPWGVCRREIEAGKKFGITYQSYSFESDTNGRVELTISTGSGYRPQTSTLPSNYTVLSNSRTAHGNLYDHANDLAVSQDDIATEMDDASFKGTPQFDIPYAPNGSKRFNDSTITNSPVPAFATMAYDDHAQRIADYNAYNSYSLDLISYQSSIDPNFVVYSFKQPNLSSTKLRDNSFMTWFVHDYTSPALFNYDELWLGGVTVISPGNNEDAPNIRFRSFLGGPHQNYNDYYISVRSAESGFLPYKSISGNGSAECTPYTDTYYGTTSLNTKQGSTDYVNIYTRSNLSHTNRSIGGDVSLKSNSQFYARQQLSNATNFNAVIKGLPLSINIAPVPYYLPNDFAMIDFDVATPSANIQQGDTITVGTSEIYTIITGSYNQDGRTRGILFCARTT